MAFASAADALCCVLEGKEESSLDQRCWIIRTDRELGTAPNGLEYYSVEVRCSNGAEYKIPAFGSDAVELWREAKSHLGNIAVATVS